MFVIHVFLSTEEVPESYWKELAEQRRIALNDSLHENEMVSDWVSFRIQRNNFIKLIM